MRTNRYRLVTGLFLVAACLAVIVSCGGQHPRSTVATVGIGPATSFRLPSLADVIEWQRGVDVGRWVAAYVPPPPVPGSGSSGSRGSGSSDVAVPPGDAEAAVRSHFGDMFTSAWGVSGCESTHNPSAVSAGGGNWGLFQINTVHRDQFEAVTGLSWPHVLEADANAAFARWLFDQSGGWGPWACKWAA